MRAGLARLRPRAADRTAPRRGCDWKCASEIPQYAVANNDTNTLVFKCASCRLVEPALTSQTFVRSLAHDEAEKTQILVDPTDDASLPRTRVECECGHQEAVFFMGADFLLRYVCVACKRRWTSS